MDARTLMNFVGNPYAFAVQQEDGGYHPVRRRVTVRRLERHLQSLETIGTYVNLGDTARFICFDVDSGDDARDQAQRVVEGLWEMGVPADEVGVEFSGRKGYHVWVTLVDYVPAHELRSLGRAVLALSNVECEVFPKQDVARDLGNLVKLPGGKHQVSGMPSEWIGAVPNPMPVVRWTEDIVPNLPVALKGKRGSGASERFPCMERICNEGAHEGSRNNELFHLATMLRRAGLTQEYTARVIEMVNTKGNPLGDEEVQSLLQSAQFSGPVCDSLPEAGKCGEECIRKRTSGLYSRPRQLSNAAEGEGVVVTKGSIVGRIVELTHPDLEQAKGVLRGSDG